MIKKQNGAITLYVTIACLFIIVIGIGAYVITSNKQAAQLEQLKQIEGIYKGNISQEELYNEYNGGDIIPIYTEGQFLEIGSGEEVYIQGKIYTMALDKTYVLKENFESNSEFTNKMNMVDNGNGVVIKEY